MSSKKFDEPALAHSASAVRHAVIHLARRLRAQQAPGGVTVARLGVLRWLHLRGAMTAGQIAEAEHLQPQSLTRLLSALEADGLIVRQVDGADRRRSALSITVAGQKVLRKEAAWRDQWLTEVMAATLSTAELALLVKASALLERLAQQGEPPA
jgi:DNA-binding MarR family transcriptional regulator